LFDQDGHPVVPTCSPRADARSGSQGWPKATAKRRLASLTVASTTAASPQKGTTDQTRYIAVYPRNLTAANNAQPPADPGVFHPD
jgi:hypothetical protein